MNKNIEAKPEQVQDVIKPKKMYKETLIFREFMLLSNQYALYFEKFKKCYQSVSIRVSHSIVFCILNMKRSYDCESVEEKLKYAKRTLDKFDEIVLLLKVLFESYKCLSIKQHAILTKICGLIQKQLNRWIESLEQKISEQVPLHDEQKSV